MIKNIVFDLGNVIIKWDPTYIVSHYTNNKDEQDEIITNLFKSKYWLLYDEGKITRNELINTINESLEEKYHAIIKEIVYFWYKHAPIIDGIEELIKDLKNNNYKIYLLSNTNIHFDEYRGTINCLKYFDGYYISATKELLKPNKEIYYDFLNEFNLEANECVFIDDSKDNIDGANNIGMIGYVFDGNVSKLKDFLIKKRIHI